MLLAHPMIIRRVGAVATPTRKCQAAPPCARSGRAMQPLRSAAKTPYAWLWEDKTLADATLLLHVTDKPAGATSPAALRVHRAVLAAHSQHFKTRVLRWADGEAQRAIDIQPSIAVVHFIEAGSLPAGLTVHQLAQVCKEAKARDKLQCAEACSQAIVALALKEVDKAQPVLPCLEETFNSLEMCDAAHLVVRCMYEGKLAEQVEDPLTLARVCHVAERWAFSSLSSTCLQQLICLPQLPAEQLVLVLQTLPDSCALLPEHKKWQELVLCRILSLFGDVHAVITSAQLRTTFQQLPFAAVQQWAGSDALTVDSENSVVELISLWMAGHIGNKCSWGQEMQLSCLVRVQHLSPAYAQGRLPTLDWFGILGAPTDVVAQAASCGSGMSGVMNRDEAPHAWFAAPRKQLAHLKLLRRTTIRWDVPRQQLVDLLARKNLTAKICSEPVYSAGAGWRVYLDLNKGTQDEAGFTLGCWGQLVTYAECSGHALGAKLPHGTPIKHVITKGDTLDTAWTTNWVQDGMGYDSVLHVCLNTAADLEPFLNKGSLQITGAFQVINRPCA
ncbi:hypothetical protein QJQ45_012427 [Haematococcus lacustris]|nr:hypothetical protein QJQ45_012427 [Haematococcus lacustris]